MSAARKCDRCGEPCVISGTPYQIIRGNIWEFRGSIALCPGCYGELEKWLKEYKETKDGKSEEEQSE